MAEDTITATAPAADSSSADSGLFGPIISTVGNLFGGMTANRMNKRSAHKAMKFSAYMANTAHQREVADLKAAGINPILTGKYGGAPSPQGVTFTSQNEFASAADLPERIASNRASHLALRQAKIVSDNEWMRGQQIAEDVNRIRQDTRISAANAKEAEIRSELSSKEYDYLMSHPDLFETKLLMDTLGVSGNSALGAAGGVGKFLLNRFNPKNDSKSPPFAVDAKTGEILNHPRKR